DRAIAAVQADNPGASPVRCWPHHFDLATLLQLDGPAAGESGRSIGAGFSPGDGERQEPYLYVTPWPYPAEPALPTLAGGGSWHREGWLGAGLPASRIVGAGSTGAQRRQVESFLDSAVAACRVLLAAGG